MSGSKEINWGVIKLAAVVDVILMVGLAICGWFGLFGGDELTRLIIAGLLGAAALYGVGLFVWASRKAQNTRGDLN